MAEKDIWTSIPKTYQVSQDFEQSVMNNQLLQIILSIVQDGVCIITPDFRIIYSNTALKSWYGYKEEEIGKACYQMYHNLKEPCKDCPVQKALVSKKPETALQFFEFPKHQIEWHQLFSVPVLDDTGEIQYIVEYVRNITDEKKFRMEKELVKKQNEILQEISTRQMDEMRHKEQILSNQIRRSVEPVLHFLRDILDRDSYSIVETQLKLATDAQPDKEDPLLTKLSEQELKVATLIRDGYISKEIAERLFISKKTVDYHRTNLRKKLDLDDTENLQMYLKKHLKVI